jgi:hypothetical protein
MGIDPRQFVLLAIALGVPVVAFLMNRTRWILPWIGFTLFVQVFDTAILTNLPAGRIVGLFYLPVMVATFRRWIALAPAKAWLLNFVYLAALGLVLGLAFPWPDTTGMRAFTLRAEGRTIIFMIRTISDLSLTVFVMNQLAKPGAFDTLRRSMIVGIVANAFAAIGWVLLHLDAYGLITGIRGYAVQEGGRARGLTYEPRGLGLACAFGLVLILGKHLRRRRDWVLLALVGLALLLSISASGIAAAIVGLVAIAMFGSTRTRLALIFGGLVLVMSGLFLFVAVPSLREQVELNLGWRLRGRGTVEANRAENAFEAVAYRLDIFDASAALFLIRNPLYVVIGTGPGLITLPASEHIPYGLYLAIWTSIDTPPTHGLLLELANTGILGVATWLFQVVWVMAAGKRLYRRRGLPFPPRTARTIFLGSAAVYAAQAGVSPYWAVFLGIGWAIAEAAAVPSRAMRHAGPHEIRPGLTPIAATAGAPALAPAPPRTLRS